MIALFLACAALGCGLLRGAPERPAESFDPLEGQAAELSAIEGAETCRPGDRIRVVWDAAALFEFDSAMLAPDSRGTLAQVAEILNRYPRTEIMVEAYTFFEAPREYVQVLSERRARSVRDSLVDLGVAPSRLRAAGYVGELPAGAERIGSTRPRERIEITIRPREAPTGRDGP